MIDALGGLGGGALLDAGNNARFAALQGRASAVRGLADDRSRGDARHMEMIGEGPEAVAPAPDDVTRPLGSMNGVRVVRSPENAARLYEKANDPELKKIRETADQFVSILYSMLFKEMDKTIERTGLTGGGKTEEMFQSFVLDEYAKNASSQNSNNPVSHRIFEMLYERTAALRPATGAPATPVPTAAPGMPAPAPAIPAPAASGSAFSARG